MIGALLMVALAATVVAATPLFRPEFDFGQGDQPIAPLPDVEVPTNYAHINYLHGSEWQYEGVTQVFTKCPGHVDHVVEVDDDLLKTAHVINARRFTGSDIIKTRVVAGWQPASCLPPRCVGSIDDLLVCGGIALAVREWVTVTGINPVRNTRDGPRGPICGTGKVRLWTDDVSPYHILPGDDSSFVFELRNMVNFARSPILCEMPAASSDPADRVAGQIADRIVDRILDLVASRRTTPTQ